MRTTWATLLAGLIASVALAACDKTRTGTPPTPTTGTTPAASAPP